MKKKLKQQKMQRQQEIINAAKTQHRELTDAERAEFDSLQVEIENLQREIEGEGNGNPDGEHGNGNQQRTIEEERKRVTEIASLCREFGMEDKDYIENGTSVEEVRKAIIEHLRSTGAPVNGRTSVEKDEGDKFREAAADAILLRGGLQIENPAEGARELMGMSLRDIGIESLTMDGKSGMNRRSAEDIFSELQRQYFNPSAAFPAIMDNAIRKAYLEGHRTAPVTFDKWMKKGSLKDFKKNDNYYLMGSAGEFLEVPEGGELKHDTLNTEKRPTRQLKTYGRQFTMTRQAFINDDIDVIVKLPSRYAASARKTQNKQCYSILVNNGRIYDGINLFDKKHKNLLATGTGITREAVQSMILALGNQIDEFGEVCIIRPATIIVPSGYQFEMYSLFWSPTINTSGNTQAVNPLYRYRESIEVVEDPTINMLCGGFGNQMPWWLLGQKEDTDFMEVDYLNGNEVPQIRRSEVPGTLGYVWDVFLDWGIAVMDYRGAVKNPGTVVESPIGVE